MPDVAAYQGARPRFGREYIIPAPFDPRLISIVLAVAKAAMDPASRANIVGSTPQAAISARRDPIAGAWHFRSRAAQSQRVVFAEGEENRSSAPVSVCSARASAVLVGRETLSARRRRPTASACPRTSRSTTRALSAIRTPITRSSVRATAAQGFLFRDCQRFINQDRNYFAAAMVARGDADAMVTGVAQFLHRARGVRRVIDPKPGHRVMGVSSILSRGKPVLLADTAITERRTPTEIARGSPKGARRRAVWASNLPSLCFPSRPSAAAGRAFGAREGKAVRILDREHLDFQYDGEVAADVALNPELHPGPYPFCRLKGPPNVLAGWFSTPPSISSSKMLQELGGATVVGPLIVGLDRAVQIVQLGAKDSESSTWRRSRHSTSAAEALKATIQSWP